ncbi:DNA polymerase family A-domain-containing protein [Melanogaster broomeanus]|nr:DNA polymerase family A-domain-containing protein [Melanogaster broomeanus]
MAVEGYHLPPLLSSTILEWVRKGETDEVVQRAVRHEKVKRNELGVQMLSRVLHRQVFKDPAFPALDPTFVQIARDHLQMHGLDPKQGSVLPDTSFTLPSLQGSNLDEHFHCIGLHSAQPWISLVKDISSTELPLKPEHFDIQSGWTQYYHRPDGSSYSEHVDYPHHGGKAESLMSRPCPLPSNAWYSWISPRLLGETEETRHLIPLGEPGTARVVVSYDRQRILEEYSLKGTHHTRFLYTMVHVAIKGVSSHQRPPWTKHRKAKAEQVEPRVAAVEAVLEIMRDAESQEENEVDAAKRAKLRRLRAKLEESLPTLQEDDSDANDAGLSNKRWEDLTSADSLADVAKLYCNIDMDKEIRGDFMKASREDIRADIYDYLNYCAHDVYVTHQVFSQVLPAFLERCQSPVSFAGILTMGSRFLTVNESWQDYLRNAERTYQELEMKVKRHLADLAEEAKEIMEGDSWKESPWLAQLDWTPKESRGVSTLTVKWVSEPTRPIRSRILTEKWHFIRDGMVTSLPSAGKKKTFTVVGTSHGARIVDLVRSYVNEAQYEDDPWLRQVDWKPVPLPLRTPNLPSYPGNRPPNPRDLLNAKSFAEMVLGPSKTQERPPARNSRHHRSKSHLPDSPPPVLNGISSLSLTSVEHSTRTRPLEFLEPADDPLYEMTQGNGEDSPTKTERRRIPGDDAKDALDILGTEFWFGGTESFVFNKLEEIALSDHLQTSALGCGITAALSKEILPADFGSDYMTSRINWVVKSSGVDYLHLLIVAMDHLIKKYGINARFLISVHDELRYLVADEDRYRAALALQIANLWTRCIQALVWTTCLRAWGSSPLSRLDTDHVLRKEVLTPSYPTPISRGESTNLVQTLEKTNGSSLWRDGRLVRTQDDAALAHNDLTGYKLPDCLVPDTKYWVFTCPGN